MPHEALNTYYSDAEGLTTFYDEEQGLRCVDHGYRLGQKVRVQEEVIGGVEIVTGTVVGLQVDTCRSSEFIRKNPATISVHVIWSDGRERTVKFNPITKFPPDFAGEQNHSEKLLD